jgi:hypothetical protein
MERVNRRFNRIETATDHRYLTDFGAQGVGAQAYSGFLKCKLAHGSGRSIVVPDILFLGKEGRRWIQPLSFGPPVLTKFSKYDVRCKFTVDVSCSQRVEVSMKSGDWVQSFADGSELYRCTISGPAYLQTYATGESELRPGEGPLLRLYHHTTEENRKKILQGGSFRLSSWNIQGTEKKVKNVGYVYFTALDKIVCDEDLKCIAMSSDEIIHMIVDGFTPPAVIDASVLKQYTNQILPLKVYRGSTKDRTATLDFKVDATVLAPQHLLLHTGNLPMWYEVCNPFTQRVSVQPGNMLGFQNGVITRGSFPAKTFEYMVVGDASSIEGLAAPYDEETTESLFKIEPPQAGRPLLQLWFDLGNTDLYSTKHPEVQEFERPS